MLSSRRSSRSVSSAFCRRARPSDGGDGDERSIGGGEAVIRVNGETEPLAAATLAALLAEKAVDTEQSGIAVALNGAVVPRAAWPQRR